MGAGALEARLSPRGWVWGCIIERNLVHGAWVMGLSYSGRGAAVLLTLQISVPGTVSL